MSKKITNLPEAKPNDPIRPLLTDEEFDKAIEDRDKRSIDPKLLKKPK